MRPEAGDIRHEVLIQGRQLAELKKLAGKMAESFGLDRRIEKYQGRRPVGLYAWDLDCLVDVVGAALRADPRPAYHPGRKALAALERHLAALAEQANERIPRP